MNQRVVVLPDDIIKMLSSDPITQGLYVTDIGYYPYAKGHYRVRKNGSPQNILIYCVDGEGWYSINDIRHQVCKNQFFILSADTPHIYAASEDKPWSIYWMHFTGSNANLLASHFDHTNTINLASDSRFEARLQLFEEIFRNLEQSDSIDNMRYASMVLSHFLGSLVFIPQFRLVNHEEQSDVVEKAIAYMKKNIHKSLTLEEIATQVKYSPSHFGSLFAKRTGLTPFNYFQQLKIQSACRYLDFTDLRMKEIAEKLGFYDQYHFSKVFAKFMKMSPTHYKSRDKA